MKKVLTYYLKPYYFRMLTGFLIKFIGTIMDLALPWILAYIIDKVTPRQDRNQVFLWGFLMLVCSLLAVSFNIIANRMASRVASDAMETIRFDLFQKTMLLSNQQIDSFSKPSLISRMTSDTYYVHQVLARMQRLGVRAPILLIGGIAVTLTLDFVLSGILICILPVLALIMFAVSRKSIPLFTTMQESTDRFVRLIREDIAGIRVIKALSKETYEKGRFDGVNKEVAANEKKAEAITAVINPAMTVLLNLGLVLVIVTGAYRVHKGYSEVGKILAFMTYFTIILNAMMSISRMFTMVSKGIASADRMMKIIETPDDLLIKQWGDKSGGDSESQYRIEFRHVYFSYDKVGDNLEDISFRLKKGETLGIIGETGSGKSTIINLMMRFYDADKGGIFIEGRPISSFPLEELRKKFGVVFQNDTIFEGNIRENVNLGRNLTDSQLEEALLYARAKEFVSQKEGKLKGKLDIKGANLSGGQRQRILIARALAAHPDILVLDDSSSALDYKTDASLRRELKLHFADTTCIIIAQRVSSIMYADHILVLEDGNAIGYGTHEELMKHCAIYREISQSQMGEAECLS